MTAIGFVLIVVAVWLSWATRTPESGTSDALSWLALIGLLLVLAGITTFLWEAMP